MEFNAIALSVEIENVKMMETARNIYQSWINNKLQIFGNEKKRQIKYLRRIITQLSLPFSINKPKTVSTFKNNFMELLHTILDDYEKIALQLDIMGNNV
ncbi:hypothetical protein TRFO_32274 [Tritrichomonas foetus]|uniref:Dynein heavy chain tail domain-containing protein n=1 Tax=Tritrichomonas foetus TaxID=1144522 RepID=A0A1J4JTU4_9EUKA|nr:hypothetical protein TRFO_32274 [Tritrichomonas foetus]|eukprot:OHT00924.1 hypothetical protein TRFO_32274 [Tritrichomonas foetus]